MMILKEFSRIVCVSLFSYQGSLLSVSQTACLLYHILIDLSRTFLNFFIFSKFKNLKRRRRDLNPRAAINDLLPFQGSPFGQLGYFSKLPYAYRSFYQKRFILYRVISVCQELFNFFAVDQQAERVGFEPTRPCGQTVFKTASL